MSGERTLSDVGEFAVVDLVAQMFGEASSKRRTSRVELGVGDDAALVRMSGTTVVAAVDQMVEGRHFRRDWSSGHDVGRKAAARAMSDIAAMGGAPTALLVALAAPRSLPIDWVRDFADGLLAEASIVGASIVGGDTVEADSIVVSVTALGDMGDHAPLTRAGASPGDTVCIAGHLGRAAAGLAVLTRGHRQPKSVVSAQRTPEPPYAAGIAAASAGATSMIDISDGLLADAGHVARASGVVIDFARQSLQGDEEVETMARNLGVEVWDWILAGGEDHALLATFPAGTRTPRAFRRVGVVLADDGSGPRVLVDGVSVDGPTGHEHFGE